MKAIEMLKQHCEFNSEYDCYVLLAVSRKKDTPSITNSQEIVFREIIRHKDDIERKYNKIRREAETYIDDEGTTYPFYVYVSLNARDSLKAFYKFQHKLVDWNNEIAKNAPMVHEKVRRTDRQFVSILASPDSRAKNRYFMIDYDQKTLVPEFKLLLTAYDIQIMLETETKNGWHFKVKPFNRSEFGPPIEGFDFEIKTDAQIFVDYIPNTNKIDDNITIQCFSCEGIVGVSETDWDDGKIFHCCCGGERFKRLK